MPIYTMICESCDYRDEHICHFDDINDTTLECPKCGGVMRWRGCETFGFNMNPHHPGAIMSDGSKQKGYWGKSAPTKRNRRRIK